MVQWVKGQVLSLWWLGLLLWLGLDPGPGRETSTCCGLAKKKKKKKERKKNKKVSLEPIGMNDNNFYF